MKVEVYCDESYPDLLSSQPKQAKYMVAGSVWLPRKDRDQYKAAIHQLRDQYKIGGEFKWNKVSPSRSTSSRSTGLPGPMQKHSNACSRTASR